MIAIPAQPTPVTLSMAAFMTARGSPSPVMIAISAQQEKPVGDAKGTCGGA